MTREFKLVFSDGRLTRRNPAAPIDYRTFAYPAFADSLLWPQHPALFPLCRTVLALILAAVTALSTVLVA